jgi:hypothetical protein
MSTSPKLPLSKEDQYIKDAYKEGLARYEPAFGLRNLILDYRFQCRIINLDTYHVKRLATLRDSGITLDPVVIFEHPTNHIYKLVSGFHRHKEVMNRQTEDTLRAHVILGDDWEAEYFAALCNQRTLLARTPQDKEQAATLLFGNPKTRDWNDAQIAEHVGILVTTVRRYRTIWAEKNPDTSAGTVPLTLAPRRDRRGRKPDPPAGYTPTPLDQRQSLTKKALTAYFAGRGVPVRPSTERGRLPAIVELDTFDHKEAVVVAVREKDSPPLHAAVSRVLTYRIWQNNPALRAIILCYKEDYPTEQPLFAYWKRLGVEVMTPEQLVIDLTSRGRPAEPPTDA